MLESASRRGRYVIKPLYRRKLTITAPVTLNHLVAGSSPARPTLYSVEKALWSNPGGFFVIGIFTAVVRISGG
jgi:hypothetical protein